MYIIAGLFNILSIQFRDLKINLEKIFIESNTDINLLKNPLARIGSDILGRYLEQVLSVVRDYGIGLQTGFLIPFTLTGNIFNIYNRCKIVSEIFENMDLVDSTANNISDFRTRVDDHLFYYEFSTAQEFIDKYPHAARFWNDLQYGIALQYAYSFTGRFLYPKYISTVYARGEYIDHPEEYLSCPVKFGQEKSALVFQSSVLNLPVVTAKKELFPVFEHIMEEIRNTEHNHGLSGLVRRFLTHSLLTTDLSLTVVAEKFNMSERSMQRKLKSEGSSYQQIPR